VSFAVELNGRHRPAQLFPVEPIAWISERAEPLRGMRL